MVPLADGVEPCPVKVAGLKDLWVGTRNDPANEYKLIVLEDLAMQFWRRSVLTSLNNFLTVGSIR
jgi:hypothetical protein